LGFKGSGERCAGDGVLRVHDGWSFRIWMFPDPDSSLRKTGPITHDSITAPRTLAVRGADCFEKYGGTPGWLRFRATLTGDSWRETVELMRKDMGAAPGLLGSPFGSISFVSEGSGTRAEHSQFRLRVLLVRWSLPA
jgi:hypothetical protein